MTDRSQGDCIKKSDQWLIKQILWYASTVVVFVLGGWYLSTLDLGKVEVQNQETVIEKEVDALDSAIKSAQENKKSEIEDIAQKAYDEAYNQEMKKVELEVIKSFSEKLDERQIELEKETKEY